MPASCATAEGVEAEAESLSLGSVSQASFSPTSFSPASSPLDGLQRLRESIRAIERRSQATTPLALGFMPGTGRAHGPHTSWTLGEPVLDALIGTAGLEPGGLHEIKPVAGQLQSKGQSKDEARSNRIADKPPNRIPDWMGGAAVARRFALALGVRWLAACDGLRREAPVLWCASAGDASELGAPYGAGLGRLGLDPARLIVVEPAKTSETLWALEEGLKASGLALVFGQLPSIGLTPARRLALAAAHGRTPCLLLTHPRAPPAAATSTRWRIAPAPSAPNPLDSWAPGAARFLVTLERCRGRPAAEQSASFVLEWCDAALRFRLASGVAAGASRPGQSERLSRHDKPKSASG